MRISKVTYLGHKRTAGGLRPDPEKVAVVKKFPNPTNTCEIKQYMGLCGYYRRFIPNFIKIAKPLMKLLRNNVPFVWDQKTRSLCCLEGNNHRTIVAISRFYEAIRSDNTLAAMHWAHY